MPGFEAMQATPVLFWITCFLAVMAVSILNRGLAVRSGR